MSALAACTTPATPPPPLPSVEVAPAPAEPAAQVGEPSPAPPPETDISPAARAARLAGRPLPPPDARREPPVRLIGLSRELVLDLLGPAGFVRRDGPVQIWRYTGDDCFLDVFLYREGEGFRVNHVEARTKNAEPVSVNACYQRLAAARRAGRSG